MVKETQYKMKQLIQELHENKHIDNITKKMAVSSTEPYFVMFFMSVTLRNEIFRKGILLQMARHTPRIPIFYTLTKIHKPTLVGRPIISGCDGPTERISAFRVRLLQPAIA